MSSIVLSPGATGAAAFTIEAPSTATSRVITLPDATDTLVGKATTDTLTNKSIAATQLTGTIAVARLPAGSVIQVVSVALTTPVAVGGTPTITGSLSITPSNSANKVLVLAGTVFHNNGGYAGTEYFQMELRRNTTVIRTIADAALYQTTNGGVRVFYGISQLDSPATTSSVSYDMYVTRVAGSVTTNVNQGGTGYISLMEVAA